METMETGLRGLLAELYDRGQEHDARQERHDGQATQPRTRHRLAVDRPRPQRQAHAPPGIGTSNGYSTICLAWAARNRRAGD